LLALVEVAYELFKPLLAETYGICSTSTGGSGERALHDESTDIDGDFATSGVQEGYATGLGPWGS